MSSSSPSSTQLEPPQPTTFVEASSVTSSSVSPSSSVDLSNSANSGITHAGSELYLFTFLTTLLLLLGVSCAIIVRSLILRRRFRRRVQEAIANGVLVPGLMDRHTRSIGSKPVMWDVWIARPGTGVGEKGLDGSLPIAATKIRPKSASGTETPQRTAPSLYEHDNNSSLARILRDTGILHPPNNNNPRRNRRRERDRDEERLINNRRAAGLPDSHSSPALVESSPEQHTDGKEGEKDTSPTPTQISLLIAMPTHSRPAYSTLYPSAPISNRRASSSSSDTSINPKGKAPDHSHPAVTGKIAWPDLEEGEVPHLELGVVEVRYRGDLEPESSSSEGEKSSS